MLELAKFKAELGQFTGTEHYYFNPLYQEMNYTDGVNYLVATVSAYWLLDIIGTEFFPQQKSGQWDSFVVIKLAVEVRSMMISVQDGNHHEYLQKTSSLLISQKVSGRYGSSTGFCCFLLSIDSAH